MFRSETNHHVSLDTYMPIIFPDGLPVNTFINKGRCAIRGTSQEMEDKSRCTIVVVPNKSILFSKYYSDRPLDRPDLIVYGDVTWKEVVRKMNGCKKGYKIMTTPEGIWKIIKAAEELHRLEELHKEWFLLLDESHTFISDSYRKNILLPFKYFWKFDKKSIISATPYYFTDPRFYSLDLHEVTFTEKLGKITLINAVSVDATLNYILTNSNYAKGNIHIFYNSVTAIRNAVLRSGIIDCNIFCANSNEKDNSNLQKLGELEKFFVEEPKSELYKKINFYTCKYFEGWDLYDAGATIVLVTDCHKSHTLIGVGSKGKQAIGRLRNNAEQVLHITNHKNRKERIELEEFRTEYLKEAETLIEANNNHILNSKFGKFRGNDVLDKFADLEDETKLATLNLMKLDQQINESANNEIYKHIDYIKEDWEKAFFDVEVRPCDIKLETKTSLDRKSKASKLEEDYRALLQLKEEQGQNHWFYFGAPPQELIKKSNPLAYKAVQTIDLPTMEQLKWNVKKVEQLVIVKSNKDAYLKLRQLIKRIFKPKQGRPDNFHFNSEITKELKALFIQLDIKDPKTGEIREAIPSLLPKLTGIKAKPAKRVNSNGDKENGLIIDPTSLILKLTD